MAYLKTPNLDDPIPTVLYSTVLQTLINSFYLYSGLYLYNCHWILVTSYYTILCTSSILPVKLTPVQWSIMTKTLHEDDQTQDDECEKSADTQEIALQHYNTAVTRRLRNESRRGSTIF